MKKVLALIATFFFITTLRTEHHAWDSSPYFNTTFLSKYDLVKETLIQQGGFKPVTFKSTDGIKLDGILLKRENAVGTIIFCAGFLPGRKEGQAPIFRMLPADYNILFFDARGHAQSEGHFWKTLNKYGKNEYKDVLGAISFIQKNIGGKIVVYGICAGAFHACRALVKLSQEKKLHKYEIVGLIFDSGFASSLKISSALRYHISEKFLPAKLTWYANKKKVKKTILYKGIAFFLTRFADTLKEILLMPGVRSIESETNLFDKIHEITCPIYFVHCKNDDYAPFKQVQQLANSTLDKTCWWIEESSHALHALKHKYEYRERMISFLNSVF